MTPLCVLLGELLSPSMLTDEEQLHVVVTAANQGDQLQVKEVKEATLRVKRTRQAVKHVRQFSILDPRRRIS